MQPVKVQLDSATVVERWVCNRGHPHPTRLGAVGCEEARDDGASDAALLALFDAEVAEFNA